MSAEEKTAVATEEAGAEEKEVETPGTTEDEKEKSDESATPDKRETPDKDTGAEEAEAETEAKPKRPGGFQRRIAKLSAQRSAAQAEAEYWREQALAGKEQPRKKEEVAVVGGKPKPRQEDFQLKEEDGGGLDSAAFTEALADWKVNQRLAERDATQHATQAQTEQQSQNQAFLEREAAFAETLPAPPLDEKEEDKSYEGLADAALGMLGQLNTAATKQISAAIAASEKGPELLYYLGQHPDELQRIAKLPPQVAVMSLGGIAASLAENTEEKGKETGTQTPLVSRAPKPPTPIRKPSGTTSPNPDSPESDRLSTKEWYRLHQAKRR
jgi:hypothetical protein